MDLQDAPHRLTVHEQLTLNALWFALNFQSAALLPIVLPTQILLFVSDPVPQATFLGWLSTVGSIIALVIPPIIGMMSDYTASTYGRRRPYVLGGTVLLLLGSFFMVATHYVWLFVLGFLIFQFANNGSIAAYQSLLPDLVPEEQRGESSGYMGLMTILGNLFSLALAAWLLGSVTLDSSMGTIIMRGASVYYLITGIIVLIGTLITLFGIHETPLALLPVQPLHFKRKRSLQYWVEQNWVAPFRNHNFTWVFLTRCSVMLGVSLFMTFIEYYFLNVLHITSFVQATAVVAVLALLGAVASALTLGMLSDRSGRVKIVCLATMLMALAALAFVVLPQNFPLWPLGLVFGVGYGAYTSVDWALAIDALPSLQAAGKDLGLWTIASTLPATIAPALGGFVIAVATTGTHSTLGYRLTFAFAVLFLILGAVFVLRVRETNIVADPYRRPETAEVHEAQQRGRNLPLGWRLAFKSRGGRARGFLRFWVFWERFKLSFWRTKPIPNAPTGVFMVHFGRYHGRPIELPDGVHVKKGDLVGELHFRNQVLLELASSKSAWGIVHSVMQDMYALERWTHQPDFPSEVRAFFGVTLISRAAPRLGFIVRDQPRTLHTQLERFFMTGLLVLYHSKGVERLLHGTTYGTYPQEVWMTYEMLHKKYG